MKLLLIVTAAIASVVGGPVTSEDCAFSQAESAERVAAQLRGVHGAAAGRGTSREP